MASTEPIDYAELAAPSAMSPGGGGAFVDDVLVPRWVAAYQANTGWVPELLVIELSPLTYLFDAAPTLRDAGGSEAQDRVVAVWGRSERPDQSRDRRRMAGFVADPAIWSGHGRDRGHLVGHAVGGGLDINLVPQSSGVNRGSGPDGRRWRAFERRVAARPGTWLFVRPLYRDPSWAPAALEFGLLLDSRLQVDRVDNAD